MEELQRYLDEYSDARNRLAKVQLQLDGFNDGDPKWRRKAEFSAECYKKEAETACMKLLIVAHVLNPESVDAVRELVNG